MGQKEEVMDKNKLIKLFTYLIQEVCDRDFDSLIDKKDGKIKFRQYPKLTKNNSDEVLRTIDITIEF
jgi:hypothetical protein